MGTRVQVGRVGQDTGFALIRIDLTGEEAAIRADLVSKAAIKLSITPPEDFSIVTAFLDNGSRLDEMSLFEKDDTLWLGFDGDEWREPGCDADDPAGGCPCARCDVGA